jgi:hypothetical protein
VASFLQQQLANLCVSHLLQANKLLKALPNLEPIMHFPCSPVTPRDIRILAWSNAAHGSTYGQSGYLGGLRLSADQQTTSVFHLLDWSSSKQSRVSFSSIGSEILTAVTAADRGYVLASNFQALFPSASHSPPFELED